MIDMSFGRGGTREGAGRPKGSRNHYNAAMEKLLQERMDELGHENYDPVIAMAEIALNDDHPIELRFRAHAEVAQYVRTKCRAPAVSQTNTHNPGRLSPGARKRRIKVLAEACGYSQKADT